MFRSGFVLDTAEKIEAAIFNKTPVVVWQKGQIIDYGGEIIKQTADAVYVQDGCYLKAVCEFRVR